MIAGVLPSCPHCRIHSLPPTGHGSIPTPAPTSAPMHTTGEWIIRQRPQAVVVETAMGPEHGAMAGNVIRCGDRPADPTAGFYLRMFCQVPQSWTRADL